MKVATQANFRTTNAAREGLAKALEIAFTGGSVMGMGVVGLGVVGLGGQGAGGGDEVLGGVDDRGVEGVDLVDRDDLGPAVHGFAGEDE